MQRHSLRQLRPTTFAFLAAAAITLAGCISFAGSTSTTTAAAAPTVAAPAGATPAGVSGSAGAAGGMAGAGAAQQAGRARPVMPDSIARQNDAWVAQVTAQIAGRENLPAEQVFRDIQVMKGVPAGRLLTIMNAGYSRALGVSCTHCHEPSAWESDAKADRKTARGMIRMVNMINEGNRSIPEFADNNVVINCTTCHQGSVRPIRNLPAPGAGRAG